MSTVADPVQTEISSTSAPSTNPRRRPSKVILALVLVVLLAAVASWYAVSQRSEETDDAQVDGHLVPVASRIDGTIQSVSVDDNQMVKAGDPLVQLDTREYEVALEQARAQADQAASQWHAAAPNVSLAQVSNQSDVATSTAQVAAAAAAVSGAEQDLTAAQARWKESLAVNDRAQANFQRYQSLYD